MSDYIDKAFNKIGITGSDSKAIQFVIGLGLVAFSLIKYNERLAALFIVGILFGGYLILKSVK